MKERTAGVGRIDENSIQKKYGIGRYGLGNIDLFARPQYMNGDGSVSTVRSMSFGTEEGEVLVPTVALVNGKPSVLSDQEAIQRYYDTGEYLGKFKTPDEATAYADKLHIQQAALYPNRKKVMK